MQQGGIVESIESAWHCRDAVVALCCRGQFDTEGKPDIPALGTMPQTGVSAPKVQYNPTYNPFNETPTTHSNATPDNWEQLYEGLGSAHTSQQQTPSLFGTDAGSVIQSRSNAASKSFADNGIVLDRKSVV